MCGDVLWPGGGCVVVYCNVYFNVYVYRNIYIAPHTLHPNHIPPPHNTGIVLAVRSTPTIPCELYAALVPPTPMEGPWRWVRVDVGPCAAWGPCVRSALEKARWEIQQVLDIVYVYCACVLCMCIVHVYCACVLCMCISILRMCIAYVVCWYVYVFHLYCIPIAL